MRIRIAAGAALVLLPLLLAGCAPATVESRAADGDYGSQILAYSKYSARGPDGKALDPVQAEHWMQKMTEQHVQYRDLYAALLLNGFFGRVDEEKGLSVAMESPQSSTIAKEVIKTLTTLRQTDPKDFGVWQQLYAETRPLCPDRYAHAGAEDTVLQDHNGGDRFDVLPDSITPDMPNVHGYIRLVSFCAFSVVEHLKDPKAYTVLADWYASPLNAKPGPAAAARALAQQRFGAGGDKAKAPAVDPADTALVRGYVLRRYRALYAVKLDPAIKRQTPACLQSMMPANDYMAQKQYDAMVDTASKAAAGPCTTGYDRTLADEYWAYGLSKDGHCKDAVARDLGIIRDDTYDDDVADRVIANVGECMESQKSWGDFDALVAALKAKDPALAPYDF